MNDQYYVHNLSSTAFELGGLSFHWYWLFYLVSFAWVFYAGQEFIKRGHGTISRDHFVKMCWTCWPALFVGGRLFYVVVYNPGYFMLHPWDVFKIWSGGMSFHGAVLGVLLVAFWQARRLKISLFSFTDLLATLAPLGIMLGRMGNFINGELVGKVSRVPWAVVFPRDPHFLPRHPSQLYAALVEGALLFILLMSQRKHLSRKAYQSTLFLLAYGMGRFIVGFFRTPDPQLGLLLGPLSLGQLFCLVMILGALILGRRFFPLVEK